MLCYAKSLQSCPTLCDPIDGSHQAPSSLGFSRQEHWSGLPFPSPMQENEKGKRSCFVEFTRRLNALLMNLWGRKCSPRPTPPPSWLLRPNQKMGQRTK